MDSAKEPAKTPEAGIWVTQSDNHIDAPFASELDALRAVNTQSYGGPVVFVRWGETLADAERRERETR